MTDAEDKVYKAFCNISNLANTYKAKGKTSGDDGDIYYCKNLLGETSYSDLAVIETQSLKTDPSKKYLAVGWADFFTPEDPSIMLALCSKYGFTNSFYRQIRPATDDYLNTIAYDRNELKMIEKAGCWDGDHQYAHISYTHAFPLYDGRLTPTNDDFRADRGDGTNELGHQITATVDDSIGSSIRLSWLRLSTELGATQWQNLTDADCIALRKSMGVFGMPVDGQRQQKVLEGMDVLSARYCGTSGYSVKDGDYTTRAPNTVDGLEPSLTNKILGGIFQGAASTQNQEVWERLLTIMYAYKHEFEGNYKRPIFWTTSGGVTYKLGYKKIGQEYGRYTNKENTKLFSGGSKYTSSITGDTRSLFDLIQNGNYKLTMATQGHGFGEELNDGLNRLESQQIYKKNGNYSRLNNIGDGFDNALRLWAYLYDSTEVDAALASGNVVEYLYNLTATDAKYSSYTAYSGSNFSKELIEITKLIAWGLIPEGIGDSGAASDLQKRSSMALGQEALYQFCKAANIEVISHENAYKLCFEQSYTPVNFFPNPTFETTILDVIGGVNAPTYPNGWNGGIVSTGVLYFANSGTYFIRQYAIIPDDYSISFDGKGTATINIYKIKNSDIYNLTDASNFTLLKTITVNSVDYETYSDTFTIENVALVEYDYPTTPQEEATQNYFKGYDNKICGIHIEVVIASGNELYLKTPLIN